MTTKTETSKSAAASKELVTLKAVCAELKLDPRRAREKLRIAVRELKNFPNLAKSHQPRKAWEWTPGSAAEREARRALATDAGS